ncbi:MAG TPA: glycosyltransferase family 39 protein, partial [Blastocatellia bacterium]
MSIKSSLQRSLAGLRLWLSERLTPRPTADMSALRRRRALACAVVFLMTLGVRLLYWQENQVELLREGQAARGYLVYFYSEEARRILKDGGVLFPQEADAGDARLIVHPPGYAILMAALHRFTGKAEGRLRLAEVERELMWIQVLSDAASASLLVLVTAELLPLALALIAGLLAALSPHLSLYALKLAPDSMVALPILLAVYFIIRAGKREGLRDVAIAGLLIGVSCWLRSNALLLAPFLAVLFVLLFKRGQRLRRALVFVGVTVLAIAPITIRNAVVYHRFIPLSIGAGITMVEGIADYDHEQRFALPITDEQTAAWDVEWHGRPDYAASLWMPDGVERDRERMARGLAVVRANPGWFAGVMLRRMGYMLRYNDLRPQETRVPSVAPALRDEPNFGHELDIAEAASPVWTNSPAELQAANQADAGTVNTFTVNQTLVAVRQGGPQTLVSIGPIPVEKHTDYVLRLAVLLRGIAGEVRVGTADPRITLSVTPITDAANEAVTADAPALRHIEVPFASGQMTSVRLFLATTDQREGGVATLGGAELFAVGPTPYQWTHAPRRGIRGLQKNLFKTNVMRGLIVVGIILLALATRRRALLLLLAVPVYYLLAQSPLHTEYRYILVIHYFLFVMAATTIWLV